MHEAGVKTCFFPPHKADKLGPQDRKIKTERDIYGVKVGCSPSLLFNISHEYLRLKNKDYSPETECEYSIASYSNKAPFNMNLF